MAAEENLTSFHVRGAKHGDATSLTWIVERLSPLLLAQARYRLGAKLASEYDPDDLVQDVWAVALPALPALETRDGRETPVLLKFLSTTLIYRVNNLMRKHIRRASQWDDGHGRDGPNPVAALPADTLGVVSRAVRAEARGLVRAAIAEMPVRDRDVLVLRGIEQRSNQEVAAELGDSANAVSLRYNRALKALRERLPDSVFGELALDSQEREETDGA